MRPDKFCFVLLGFVTAVTARAAHSRYRMHSVQHHASNNESAASQQIFYGRFVSTPSSDKLLIQTGAVLVSNGNGTATIVKVSWDVQNLEEARKKLGAAKDTPIVHASENGFFFPGFIDTHIHAPQYPNLGLFEGTQLDSTFPMESSLGNPKSPAYAKSTTPPNPYHRAQKVYSRVVARTLSYGTTTAAYYATIDIPATNLLASAAYRLGQRAYIGRTCMDNKQSNPEYYRDESTEAAINKTWESVNFIQNLDPSGELVAPIITPRSAPAVTPESMRALAGIAKQRGLRIQAHLSENKREVDLVGRMYPNSTSYTGVYDAYGLATNRTIFAHGVHLSDAEMKLIAARKSKVSHCPTSNEALGSGPCQVRRLLAMGVDVGLGTDAAGGYSPSILESVRQAFLVSRTLSYLNNDTRALDVPVTMALWLATVGGSKVVSMAGRLGGFQAGMLWDVQEIELGGDSPVDILGWETWDERVKKWVWNGDDRNVKRVWVGGRLVHQRSGGADNRGGVIIRQTMGERETPGMWW